MATKKKLTFEEQLNALEKLITNMENGEMPLEDSLRAYEEGMKMAEQLEKELQNATQRLTVLRKNAAGEDVEVPIEEDEP
jgi:exodeoxyribonuclease VII small subunit